MGIVPVPRRLLGTVGGKLQYCVGCSVHWGLTSVLWRVFSTVEGYLKYCGWIASVLWGITLVL